MKIKQDKRNYRKHGDRNKAMILMYGKPMPEACGDVPFRSYENDTFGAQFAARVKASKEE